MRDATGPVLIVALIVFGVLGFVYILVNQPSNPKPHEVYSMECGKRGGSAKTKEGYDNGIYTKDYTCEVPK